jgi:hypothetical protein
LDAQNQKTLKFLVFNKYKGVADLGYEGLNMQVRETSIHKTSGFSSYFFHTLIKQRQADVPSPHQTQCYHGCTGRNRGECKKSAETQQTQKFKHLDGVCDNRGPDQRDITDLLDGMFWSDRQGSG